MEPEPIALPTNRSTHSTARPTPHLRLHRNRQVTDGQGTPSTPQHIVFRINQPSSVQSNTDTAATPPLPQTEPKVCEPSRPVNLVGTDGVVAQTLNSREN